MCPDLETINKSIFPKNDSFNFCLTDNTLELSENENRFVQCLMVILLRIFEAVKIFNFESSAG